MSAFVSSNLVPSRPKEQARYTIRELLILGLTLPVRFCPINKFGPEALGLEIISFERINESLMQYEREQMRQWQVAQYQARKLSHEAAKARHRREEKESAETGDAGSASQDADMEGEGDKTLTDDMVPPPTHRYISRVDAYRHPNRPEALHFQIPSSHRGAPVNINIGLSLEYASIPRVTNATAVQQTETGHGNRRVTTAHYVWDNKPQPSASLSKYLKEAPSTTHPPTPPVVTANEHAASEDIAGRTTPPTETTSSGAPTMSHGVETPNSMAVERATEPSLTSYSPRSSIRAPSDADYTESPPPLSFASPSRTANPQFHYPPTMETSMSESVATLVTIDSPPKAAAEKPDKKDETGEDLVVVSSATSESAGGVVSGESLGSSVVDLSGSSSMVKETAGSAALGTGKAFLGKGKIDAKAQDEFIAFMLGKK